MHAAANEFARMSRAHPNAHLTSLRRRRRLINEREKMNVKCDTCAFVLCHVVSTEFRQRCSKFPKSLTLATEFINALSSSSSRSTKFCVFPFVYSFDSPTKTNMSFANDNQANYKEKQNFRWYLIFYLSLNIFRSLKFDFRSVVPVA